MDFPCSRDSRIFRFLSTFPWVFRNVFTTRSNNMYLKNNMMKTSETLGPVSPVLRPKKSYSKNQMYFSKCQRNIATVGRGKGQILKLVAS